MDKCVQVIEKTESNSKRHVDDSQNYRHLHLEGVQKRQLIGGNVPDL